MLDCKGFRTACLRGIPLASWYGNRLLSWQKFRIPQIPMLLLILKITKTFNISYNRSCVKVKALGEHSSILTFHVKNA